MQKHYAGGMLDITGDDGAGVEIQIRADGKVIWINAGEGCVLRICRIEGKIEINGETVVLSPKSAPVID